MSRAHTVALADSAVSSEANTIAALHTFALALVGSADLNEILRQALLAAARLTASPHATALLLDEQSERICYRVALDSGNIAPLEMVAGPMMSRGLAGWVVRERQPALIRDTEQDPRWLPGPGLGDLRSAIVVPLCYNDHALGLITLGHEAPYYYDQQHLRLLEMIGAQAALAVAHGRRAGQPIPAPADRVTHVTWNSQPGRADRDTLPDRPAAREVVALSAQLHGLTGVGARLPPETFFDEVLRTFFQAMADIVHRHGAAVDTIASDTLLAIFDAEGGAESAAHAALEMQSTVQWLRARWRARLEIEVGGLDIGLARGAAIVGWIGVSQAASRAVGEVIVHAARLRELARGGEILASAAVTAALGTQGAFSVETLPPLRLADTPPQQIARIGPPYTDRPTQVMGVKRPRW